MKKLATAAMASLVLLAACTDKAKIEQTQSENTELRSDLEATLATQDSLFALINDITDGMSQIKDMEKIMSTPGGLNGDSRSRKEQLRNDMIAIKEALQQRRERLAQLEQQLKASSGKNATLIKTIENMKTQIAEQETEIATLTNQLSAANIQIASLSTAVDSLTTSVAAETQAREIAQKEATELNNELNTCYYAIGTKSELQKTGIIHSGFLRKTKIMEGDFDRNYFTTGDKRTLTTLPLHSKKAKVVTNQPKDSYELKLDGDQMVLTITDPAKFWSLSNFLVVQVD